MLDEQEWAQVEPLLTKDLQGIKDYRKKHGASLGEAKRARRSLALEKYRDLTGYPETNPDALRHRRRSDYGPECPQCGKLLRTPRARLCAACGWEPNPTETR